MRFLVIGAGAIGGVVAARLAQAGHEIRIVARGRNGEVIARDGLRIVDPDGQAVVRVPVSQAIPKVSFTDGEVVLCAVKSQHTASVVDELRRQGDEQIRIVCLQNGVENERTAMRRFEHVYGCAVMCPAVHLEPGIVHAHAGPVTGLLDVGRYPGGVDPCAEELAAAFSSATFRSLARDDIVEVKYGKLLSNLGNAIEIVCGPEHRRGRLGDVLRDEATTVLAGAGITFAPDDDPRRGLITPRTVAGQDRIGGSTLQSIERGAGSLETDFLNGEIVLLGRLNGTSTPANGLMTQLAHDVLAGRRPAGSLDPSDVLAILEAA